MAIIEVSNKLFKDNHKTVYDLAESGKQVIIKRRNKQAFLLTAINKEEDLCLTSEMEARVEEGIKQYQEGKCIIINTKEELIQLFENL